MPEEICRSYTYPASESSTDRLELAMDRYKLARERLALQLAIQFDWEVALDVGSGIGRYFNVFAETASLQPNIRRHLTAVEPDFERRREAIMRAREITAQTSLTIEVVADLEQVRKQGQFDLITCSQVAGHLTHEKCIQLFEHIKKAKKTEGVVVLLLPAVMNDGIARLVPWPESIGADYYYAVDLALMPDREHYATAMQANEYDHMVLNPQKGRLPVRAFNVGSVDVVSPRSYPAALSAIPRPIQETFQVSEAFSFIYSVHRYSPIFNRAILADILIRFR